MRRATESPKQRMAWCGCWLREATDEPRGDGGYEQQYLIDVDLATHCSASGGVILHLHVLLHSAALAGTTALIIIIIIIIITIIIIIGLFHFQN